MPQTTPERRARWDSLERAITPLREDAGDLVTPASTSPSGTTPAPRYAEVSCDDEDMVDIQFPSASLHLFIGPTAEESCWWLIRRDGNFKMSTTYTFGQPPEVRADETGFYAPPAPSTEAEALADAASRVMAYDPDIQRGHRAHERLREALAAFRARGG